ncbi:UDP-N-acetylmuramate dehydrogenase [Candidatus Vampirococcus lugosii]|uniref:UDP-N-acetylenolpyruvoylglucosamine reductase n=1 Tax=Candidatus Vampirococcus lugosii TaxID=2789015 RepID=A0ABS5QJS2_9BACT|nr:UDP-N-acetylmuramate dehydrogenase [Candidatus Vampirococcus lugosii]MBS8121516.1 UDP-N-acetylenolpyruvoylglucosamine reductase (MurB) [Candidatus Vampirococcus lugosii]
MCFLKRNIDISNFSNFKTKASAKYFFQINNLQDVLLLNDLFDFANKNNLKILFVGAGTNILFAFYEFDGIIIKNNLNGFDYDKGAKILNIYSNELISNISEKLEYEYDENIWHRFIGLPGTVGGAIYGNAGCFGLEISSNILNVEVYDFINGNFLILNKEDINFGYRKSFFKDNFGYLIIKASFDLSKIKEKYSSDVDNIYFRENKQPKGNSCGSFFQNPSKDFSAGKLIQEVNLKGFTYGSAFFSDKHANFLMTNKDFGDYNDLLYLIKLAQKKVKNQFNIELIPEVKIATN